MEKEPTNIAQTLNEICSGAQPFATVHDENGDQIPALVLGRLPPNWTHSIVDFEAHLGAPRRARGKYVAHSIASFAALYNAFAAVNHGARIYRWAVRDSRGTALELNFVGVINDDATEGPGWRDLRVVLELQRTPVWLRWTGLFGKPVAQFKLARILEEYSGDIATPAGADLLKLAMDLEATKSAQFKGTINLQNRDTGLTFVEKTETTITVPREVVLRLTPFLHEDREYPVPAFLRYELGEGKVHFTLEPKQWDMWCESIYDDVIMDLFKALPDATWIDGVPPAERAPGK